MNSTSPPGERDCLLKSTSEQSRPIQIDARCVNEAPQGGRQRDGVVFPGCATPSRALLFTLHNTNWPQDLGGE